MTQKKKRNNNRLKGIILDSGQVIYLNKTRRGARPGHPAETIQTDILAPACPYCLQASARISGLDLYPSRPDMAARTFYRCKACDAHVGCHEASGKPLGTLANRELRQARMAAHDAFDPLWKAKARLDNLTNRIARDMGYRWLAEEMSIPVDKCHIGMFDVDECRRVLQVIKDWRARVAQKKDFLSV